MTYLEYFLWSWALWGLFIVWRGHRVFLATTSEVEVERQRRVVHAHVPVEARRAALSRFRAHVGGDGVLESADAVPERSREELYLSPAFSGGWSARVELVLVYPLFVVRVVVLVLGLLLAVAVLHLSILGLPAPRPPLSERSWWRHALRRLIPPITRLLLWTQGVWWLEVRGKVAGSKEAPVVVGNHVSFLEAVGVTGYASGSAVSKGANFHVPLFGATLYAMECVYLSRESADSRAVVMQEIKKRAGSGGKWPPVVIFPEGTCSHGDGLLEFQKGAFAAGVPVQPVVTAYTAPRGKLHPALVDIAPPTGELTLRLLASWTTHMRMDFLPVYRPSAEERGDPHLFAANVRKVIAAHLGAMPHAPAIRIHHRPPRVPSSPVPTPPHAFLDIILTQYSRALHPPHHISPLIGAIESGPFYRLFPSAPNYFYTRALAAFATLLKADGRARQHPKLVVGLSESAFAKAFPAATEQKRPHTPKSTKKDTKTERVHSTSPHTSTSTPTSTPTPTVGSVARTAASRVFKAFAPEHDAWHKEEWVEATGDRRRYMDLREFLVFLLIAREYAPQPTTQLAQLIALALTDPDKGSTPTAHLTALLPPHLHAPIHALSPHPPHSIPAKDLIAMLKENQDVRTEIALALFG